MKQISQIVTGNQGGHVQRAPLTDEQIQIVGYFFARLRVIYGNQYAVNYPDETTEKLAKREYAREICSVTPEKLAKGFEVLHKQRQTNAEAWKYLDIDKIIGLIKNGAEGVSRPPSIEATKQLLTGIEYKRTPEECEEAANRIASLRKGLI